MLWVGLQCMSVAFPGHTHLVCAGYTQLADWIIYVVHERCREWKQRCVFDKQLFCYKSAINKIKSK